MNVEKISSYNINNPDIHLTYRGGKLLKNPSFSSIFLGKYWLTERGKSDKEFQDKFAGDLIKGPYTHIWKEYGVKKGKFIGSTVFPEQSKNQTIDDSKIQKIVWEEIKNNKVKNESVDTIYTVYLPPGKILEAPGEEITSLDGLGGYHSSFDLPNGKRIYYAALVYSAKENGIDFTGKSKDNITITASHEWTEAVTDPDVNNGKLGWYDNRFGEIADIIISIGTPIKQAYDYLNGYAVQKEWSNRDKKFEI